MGMSIASYFMVFGYVTGIHTYAPKKVAAVTGYPVTMSCGTYEFELYRLLYFRGVDEHKEILLFNGEKGLSRLAMTKDDLGRYQVRIENVTAFDAGTYRCVARMSKSGGTRTVAEFKSDLIVIDSHPKCNTNASSVDYQGRVGEILLLYCTVNYTGNWSPYMDWSRNDGLNITSTSKVIRYSNSITSALTIRLNPSDNYVTFACKTAFTNSTEIEAKAQVRKTPEYLFIWNFTAIVLFSPQIIEITPRAESYSRNERLLCAADGNPNPSCTWVDLDTNREVAKGCLLSIDKNMRQGQVYNYQCKAENTIAGVRAYKSTNTTFRIMDQTEPWTFRQNSIIGLAVAIAVGIILLSVLATRIKKGIKRKCHLNASKEHSMEVPSSPHDYDSISDADIPMNQLGRNPVVAIENMEEEDENEGNPEEGDQETEFHFNAHSTPVNDAVTDSTHEAHSYSVTHGDYSSLEVRPMTQPAAYSQLDAQVTSEAVAYENDEQTDSVSSIRHSYYNVP